jgi:WD40 repeat protein
VSIGRDKQVRVWDLQTRSEISSFAVEGYLKDADVSADGRLLTVVFTNAGEKKSVAHVWDLEQGEQLCELVQNFDWTNCVRISADGKRLVTSGIPAYGVLWDVSTGKKLARLDLGETPHTESAAFSGDGRLLALGAVGRVRLFDAASGDNLGEVRVPNDRAILDLAFAPNGNMLASGQMGGHITLIDVQSRNVMKTLQGSESPAIGVRFVNQDRFLLITCDDQTLRLWDLQQGKVVATAATGTGANREVSVSPDGRYAFTASGEQWDTESNKWKANGDYALRLWRLPRSVWAAEPARPATPPRNLNSIEAPLP